MIADSTRNENRDFIRKQDNVFCSIYEDDAKNCKEVVLTPPPLSPISAPTSPVDLRKKSSSSVMSPQRESCYSTLSLVPEQRQDIVVQCDEDRAQTRTRRASRHETAVVGRVTDEIAACDRRSGQGGVTRMNSRVKTVGEYIDKSIYLVILTIDLVSGDTYMRMKELFPHLTKPIFKKSYQRAVLKAKQGDPSAKPIRDHDI